DIIVSVEGYPDFPWSASNTGTITPFQTGVPVNSGPYTFTFTDVDSGNTSVPDTFSIVDGNMDFNGGNTATSALNFLATSSDIPTEKTFEDGRPVDEGDPFTVYSGLTCELITYDDIDEAVRQRFEYSQERAVEREFWSGAVGSLPALSTD